ncbi:MAG: hypothetical protein AAF333_14680 [Planctomycetota bacterium]
MARLVFALCATLLLGCKTHQPAPETLPGPALSPDPRSIWGPLPADPEKRFSANEVARQICHAEPTGVLWVAENADRFDQLTAAEKRLWVEAVRWYRLDVYAPRVAEIARSPESFFAGRELVWARDPLYRALAALRSPDTIDSIWDGVNNEALKNHTRAELAAAMVTLGDERGRAYLLEAYRYYLIHLGGPESRSYPMRQVLERFHDPLLIEQIEDLPNRIDFLRQTQINNARTLVRSMRVNGWPLEDLREAAAAPEWSSSYLRYDAVEALGERGTPDDLALLENLSPWDRGIGLQQDLIKQAGRRSALAIRYRYWQVLGEEGGENKQDDREQNRATLRASP